VIKSKKKRPSNPTPIITIYPSIFTKNITTQPLIIENVIFMSSILVILCDIGCLLFSRPGTWEDTEESIKKIETSDDKSEVWKKF